MLPGSAVLRFVLSRPTTYSKLIIVRALRSSEQHVRIPLSAPIVNNPTTSEQLQHTQTTSTSSSFVSELEIDWNAEMKAIRHEESYSVLEPPQPALASQLAIDAASPYLRPTHNLAAYVNKSETLQKLLQLGVDLHRIEKRKGLAEFVLRLDFERDVRDHLQFLTDVGLDATLLGAFVTKNPLIFKEDLNNLETRINYLQSKRFKAADIVRIVEKNPFWLMFRTQRIDARLGYFQKQYDLLGDEIRGLAVRQPRLITYNMEAIRQASFSIKEELGFTADETKVLLLTAPKLWMMNRDTLMERFEYVHKHMNIGHSHLCKTPEILYCREHRLQQRHGFLVHLGKAQYDPTEDLYVSFKKLVEGSDQEFCLNVAKASYASYEAFLRAM